MPTPFDRVRHEVFGRLAGARFVIVAMAAFAAIPTVARAQHEKENLGRCLNKGNAFSATARIAGCTALLEGELPQKYRPYAFNDRAIAFQAERDYARAIADYTGAIRLKPDFAHAWYNRGTAHQAQGDYDRAIADYTEAIRLQPTYFRAYKNRGLAYQAKGDSLRAGDDLSEASRLKPTTR
jgi:tetratricopeptide (TPR) repeat protein